VKKSVRKKVYGFDVDNTLNIGPYPGPVTLDMVWDTFNQGNIVGVCGHYALVMKAVPQWWKLITFFGGHPGFIPYKPAFMQSIKQAILLGDSNIDAFIMVGNTRQDAQNGLVLPTANDDGAARLAGWGFLKEDQFAAGYR
jgi:hypothetical protein